MIRCPWCDTDENRDPGHWCADRERFFRETAAHPDYRDEWRP